jgi:hypothetical protein
MPVYSSQVSQQQEQQQVKQQRQGQKPQQGPQMEQQAAARARWQGAKRAGCGSFYLHLLPVHLGVWLLALWLAPL